MGSAPPDDADLQRLDALQRDLQAAIDRAVQAGASPADVLTCLAFTFGATTAHAGADLNDPALFAMMRRIAGVGREATLAERAINAASVRSYGGEALRRRARR